jgi:hypothetical protein
VKLAAANPQMVWSAASTNLIAQFAYFDSVITHPPSGGRVADSPPFSGAPIKIGRAAHKTRSDHLVLRGSIAANV